MRKFFKNEKVRITIYVLSMIMLLIGVHALVSVSSQKSRLSAQAQQISQLTSEVNSQAKNKKKEAKEINQKVAKMTSVATVDQIKSKAQNVYNILVATTKSSSDNSSAVQKKYYTRQSELKGYFKKSILSAGGLSTAVTYQKKANIYLTAYNTSSVDVLIQEQGNPSEIFLCRYNFDSNLFTSFVELRSGAEVTQQ